MQVGDLVKLHGSPWLGIGVVLDIQSWNNTALVQFPSADPRAMNNQVYLNRQRLEVINESD